MNDRNFNIKHITLFEIIGYIKKGFLKYSIILLVLIAVCLIVLSWQNNYYVNQIADKARDQFVDVVSIFSGSSKLITNQIKSYQEFIALKSKYNSIEQENQELRQQNILALQAIEENKQLKKLLFYKEQTSHHLLTTKIIGNLSTTYQRVALIDLGEADGIKKGQVVTSNNNLIGRIIGVGVKQAELLLITDLNSNIPFLTNQSRERGVAIGNNSDYLNIKYLPEDSKSIAGELVVTSGDGEFFPANIPIGYIVETPQKDLLIKPIVDWGRLEFVQVIIPSP